MTTEAGTILDKYTIPDDGRSTLDAINKILSLSRQIDEYKIPITSGRNES